jgi:hypothetical protein
MKKNIRNFVQKQTASTLTSPFTKHLCISLTKNLRFTLESNAFSETATCIQHLSLDSIDLSCKACLHDFVFSAKNHEIIPRNDCNQWMGKHFATLVQHQQVSHPCCR